VCRAGPKSGCCPAARPEASSGSTRGGAASHKRQVQSPRRGGGGGGAACRCSAGTAGPPPGEARAGVARPGSAAPERRQGSTAPESGLARCRRAWHASTRPREHQLHAAAPDAPRATGGHGMIWSSVARHKRRRRQARAASAAARWRRRHSRAAGRGRAAGCRARRAPQQRGKPLPAQLPRAARSCSAGCRKGALPGARRSAALSACGGGGEDMLTRLSAPRQQPEVAAAMAMTMTALLVRGQRRAAGGLVAGASPRGALGPHWRTGQHGVFCSADRWDLKRPACSVACVQTKTAPARCDATRLPRCTQQHTKQGTQGGRQRRAARSASSAVLMRSASRRAAVRREPGGSSRVGAGMVPAPPSWCAAPQAAGPVGGGAGRGGLVGVVLGAAGGSECCRHAPAESAPQRCLPLAAAAATRSQEAGRLEPIAGQGGAAQWRDGGARAREAGARCCGSRWPAKELLRAHRPFHHMGTNLTGARASLGPSAATPARRRCRWKYARHGDALLGPIPSAPAPPAPLPRVKLRPRRVLPRRMLLPHV